MKPNSDHGGMPITLVLQKQSLLKKKGRWNTDDPIEWRINQIAKKHPDWSKGGKLKAKAWTRKHDKYGRMISRLQATHKVPNFEIINRMKAAGAKPSSGHSGG